ncbi:MAG: hypothetical protein ACREJ2_06500, partial [Planctomycetota bacterium]
ANPAASNPAAPPAGVVLTQLEIPTPVLRPGALLHSRHMTVIRLRVLPPREGVVVHFELQETPAPGKLYSPGTRPAMLTHPLARTDTAGIARTWLVAGEMESTVTVSATCEFGAQTKSVQISRTGLSQILLAQPALPAPPPPATPATPAEPAEPAAAARAQTRALIAQLNAAAAAARPALVQDLAQALSAQPATARPALQAAVTDPHLTDDTRRLCARLLLGAREATPRIDFIAVLRDDRPEVQEAGLAALERHSADAIRPLALQLAQSVDPADRVLAVRMARFLDDDTLDHIVRGALGDEDPLVAAVALQAAVRYLGPDERKAVARHLFDPRPLVAWTALQLLEEAAEKRAALPLSEQAAHDEAPFAMDRAALQAVRALAGPPFAAFRARALAVLPRLIPVDAAQWRETLATGRWTDDELPPLLQGLGYAPHPPRDVLLALARRVDSAPAIRQAAALACIHATPPESLSSLFPWFASDSEAVRIEACQRFRQLTAHDFGALPDAQSRILDFWRDHGHETPAEWMLHSIRSKDPLRSAAARNLPGLIADGALEPDRALDALETMVDDADGSAQAAALIAIARIDPDGRSSAARRLADALQTAFSNREDFRATALIEALATALGPGGFSHAAQARLQLWQPLIAALDHRDHAVRAAAAELLVSLTGFDFGFDPAAPPAAIHDLQTQYKTWFQSHWPTDRK